MKQQACKNESFGIDLYRGIPMQHKNQSSIRSGGWEASRGLARRSFKNGDAAIRAGLITLLLLGATATVALADPPSRQCIEWRRLAQVHKECRQVCLEKYRQQALSGTATQDDYILARAHRAQCFEACNKKTAPYSSASPNSPCY